MTDELKPVEVTQAEVKVLGRRVLALWDEWSALLKSASRNFWDAKRLRELDQFRGVFASSLPKGELTTEFDDLMTQFQTAFPDGPPSDCKTPGAVYEISVGTQRIGAMVYLPKDLALDSLTERQAKDAERIIHDRMESIVQCLHGTRPIPPLPDIEGLVEEMARFDLARVECEHMRVVDIIARARDAIESLASSNEARRVALEALDWLGTQHSLELSYCSPTYCDDDDPEEWQVHRQGGSINDREWDLVGAGDTPLAAILAARKACLGEEGGGVD